MTIIRYAGLLNDSIISGYGVLVDSRSEAADEREADGDQDPRGVDERNLLRAYCVEATFYAFEPVNRWHRKVRLYVHDSVFVAADQEIVDIVGSKVDEIYLATGCSGSVLGRRLAR